MGPVQSAVGGGALDDKTQLKIGAGIGAAVAASLALTAALAPLGGNQRLVLLLAAVIIATAIVAAHAAYDPAPVSTLRLDAIAEAIPVLVWEADASTGALRWVTGRCQDIVGVSPAALRREGFARYVHPDDRPAHAARFAAPEPGRAVGEYRFCRPDGLECWLRDDLEWVQMGEQRVLRGVTIDITKNRQQDLALLQREQLIEGLDQMTVVLAWEKSRLVVTQVINAFGWLAQSNKCGPEDHLGFATLLPGLADNPRLVEALERIARHRTARLPPIMVTDHVGVAHHVEINVCELPGNKVGMLIDDVTERERIGAQILHEARHDHLTGLANRAVLLDTMTEYLHKHERVALLLLDLNAFKTVNDTLGHLTGDEVLKVIAARLGRLGGEGDVIARLGGDEFAVLIRGGEPAFVEEIIGLVLDRCRQAVSVDSVAVVLGASIGVAFGPAHADDAEGLLRCADVAMYAAKRNDQGHRYFSPDLNADRHHLELLAAIRPGLEAGQFGLLFQPKIGLSSGCIVGAEALVRWSHPEHGLLLPEEFLGLVSMAGFGDEMADVTLTLAIEAARALPPDMTVAVNLTANNLRQRDLVARTLATARALDLDLARLTIEITESHIIDNTGLIHRTIHEFAAAGARVSIDDFGTGYSSMVNLRTLPLSELKVDRTFVSAMRTNPNDLAIVRSVIDLGHSLGLSVTAEGVEDGETDALLAGLGADIAQGYFHGRPMPLADLMERIEAEAIPTVSSRAARTRLNS